MKSFATTKPAAKPALILPAIVQYQDSKLVVLLTELAPDRKSYCGVVLMSDREDYPVGTYSQNWWKAKFDLFNDAVCLSN